MATTPTRTTARIAALAAGASLLMAGSAAADAPTVGPLLPEGRTPASITDLGFVDQPLPFAVGVTDPDGSGAQPYYARRTDSGRKVVHLLDDPSEAPRAPVLEIDGIGNGAVAWTSDGKLKLRLIESYRLVGKTQLVDDLGSPSVEPWVSLSIDTSNARVMVMWRGTTSKGRRVQWRLGTPVSAERPHLGRTHTLGEDGTMIHVQASNTGRFVAAWNSTRGDDARVSTAARLHGEFTRPRHIDAGGVNVGDIDLTNDEPMDKRDTRWFLAYTAVGKPTDSLDRTPAGDVYTATRTERRGFRRPERLDGGESTMRVDLASSGDGRAVLAMTRAVERPQDGSEQDVVSAAVREVDADGFGAAQDVSARGFMPLLAPWVTSGAQVAVSSLGTATIGWGRMTQGPTPTSPARFAVEAARSTTGKGFGSPITLDSTVTPQTSVFAAAGASTTAYLGWESDGGIPKLGTWVR